MTRDEVLKEFYATPAVPGGSSDRMADEIVRLREERDAMCEKYRAVFVAAKIWEASFNTPTALKAAEAWDDNNAPEYRDACATLLAAVAAAEQEVANDR